MRSCGCIRRKAGLRRSPSSPDGLTTQTTCLSTMCVLLSPLRFACRSDYDAQILAAIASHYSEAHVRAKFAEYALRFVRVASRYEEDLLGSTSIGFPSSSYTERPGEKSRLGSGAFFLDDAACTKELAINAGRIEAWRRTECYRLYQTVSPFA